MSTGENPFEVVVRHEAGRAVVALDGELDIGTVGRLDQAMRALDDDDEVVLDLRALRFLDTSGLRAVIDEDRRATAAGRRLTLVPGPRGVQRVFELAGVLDRLPFVPEEG
jgi:anti-sigma B factor antagonist